MEIFVEKPNLPQGRVRTVVLGNAFPAITSALNALDIKTICLPPNNKVAPPLRAHADMSAYYSGKGELIISSNVYNECLQDAFPDGTQLQPSASESGEKYPMDIGLNACEIGEYIFCSEKHTDRAVIDSAQKRGKRIVNVRQGYAKCSVCVVDERHIITADTSIAAAAAGCGIEALLIKPGFFELPGYDYGFIGGSAFKPDKSTLAFTGSLAGHENEREILEFVTKCGIDVVYLTKERCFDIGSIIPITEER